MCNVNYECHTNVDHFYLIFAGMQLKVCECCSREWGGRKTIENSTSDSCYL